MEIIVAIWYLVLFAVSLFGYVSFTVVTHDLLATLASAPARSTENSYKLKPLTNLFETDEKLLAVLQLCRLACALPVVLIAFEWAASIHITAAILILLLMFPLLYLLPVWVPMAIPRKVFRLTAQAFSYLLYPPLWVLDRFSGSSPGQPLVDEEKKKTNGEQEEEESEEFKGDIIKAVSTIEETTVREVMTPRVDMVTISHDATMEELHAFFREHKFSRVPVYKESPDSIVGIVGVMDFVVRMPELPGDATADTIMRPPLFVPETKKVFSLLRQFRESHSQMAIVIDEYGGTSGLVTLEDLLEEIVGDIADEFDEASVNYVQIDDNNFLFEGKIYLKDFYRIVDVDETVFENGKGEAETLAGLILEILGNFPQKGQVIEFGNYLFTIESLDKKRIKQIKVTLK